jgi:hypothetical protein
MDDDEEEEEEEKDNFTQEDLIRSSQPIKK